MRARLDAEKSEQKLRGESGIVKAERNIVGVLANPNGFVIEFRKDQSLDMGNEKVAPTRK